jgi:sigma-B regulation protein RsbU (phosphoserine phosphatase)
MVYVNAGHEYPAIRRAGGLFTIEKDVHCAALAARKKTEFKSGVFIMHPGDTIYQYTDGVTEANDLDGNLFGKAGLLEALNQDPDLDPQSMDEQVHQALAAFQQDAAQFDDLTMLCLKYNGPGEE